MQIQQMVYYCLLALLFLVNLPIHVRDTADSIIHTFIMSVFPYNIGTDMEDISNILAIIFFS